jgi:hypothetical protein
VVPRAVEGVEAVGGLVYHGCGDVWGCDGVFGDGEVSGKGRGGWWGCSV